jgi:hypothetical protein
MGGSCSQLDEEKTALFYQNWYKLGSEEFG